jgi:hypothetical protein
MPKFTVGSGKVWIACDNVRSFRIVDEATEKTVALIPCDRESTDDNERGLKIAKAVAYALNELVTP